MFRHNGGRTSVSVKEYYRRKNFSIRVNYVLVCRLPGGNMVAIAIARGGYDGDRYFQPKFRFKN